STIRSDRPDPSSRCTRSNSRPTSRTTSARSGSRHADDCKYTAPSDRSVRHTCTRSDACPADNATVTSNQRGAAARRRMRHLLDVTPITLPAYGTTESAISHPRVRIVRRHRTVKPAIRISRAGVQAGYTFAGDIEILHR